MSEAGGSKRRRRKRKRKPASELAAALSELEVENHNASAAKYEFRRHEEEVFRSLSSKMGTLATLTYVSCAAVTAQGAVAFFASFDNPHSGAAPMFGVLIIAIFVSIGVVTATWTARAGRAFREIVRTEGSDIEHLMSAMGDLDRLFNLQATLAAFGAFGAVLGTLYMFSLM